MKFVGAAIALAVTASAAMFIGLVGLVAIVAGGIGGLSSAPIDSYSLPVPADALSMATLVEPHHDYAAWDGSVPVGTAVFAMTSGVVATVRIAGVYPTDPNRCGNTIVIAGDDGASYIYCHLAAIAVHAVERVSPGQQIALSGGTPGAPGAGNTTGAHLHVAVRVGGTAVCPQPLLLAIALGRPIALASAPGAGCERGEATTDWSRWLGINPIPEDRS
jgi:hypothetical protein